MLAGVIAALRTFLLGRTGGLGVAVAVNVSTFLVDPANSGSHPVGPEGPATRAVADRDAIGPSVAFVADHQFGGQLFAEQA
ncbi:MAG: hypothetical protein ACRD0P_02250, partial [Stackebrandtia sp.]